ncbi:MAG: hypothetical protein ACK5JT_07125 [Hyphomicrobiaceae bacterium]
MQGWHFWGSHLSFAAHHAAAERPGHVARRQFPSNAYGMESVKVHMHTLAP